MATNSDELIREYTPRARSVGRQYARRWNCEAEDCEQTSIIGLIQAARAWDPTGKTYAFWTWAYRYITNALSREKGLIPIEQIPVAESVHSRYKNASARAEGRSPRLVVVPFDAPADPNNESAGTIGDRLANVDPREDNLNLPAGEIPRILRAAGLTEQERMVINDVYLAAENSQNCAEVARREGISRARVHQVKQKALEKIRAAAGER
jgi:RNA polymerase sigma factor (sigma-70 family)